jgi:hypothetical protein
MTKTIRTYADLMGHMREALRREHPEWVGPHGESSICDSYEARLAGLLELFASRSGNSKNL